MQYDFPQIVFAVRTIDDVQLVGQSFPNSKENILKNLQDRTVWVDYVPYALKNGDSFVLYGQQALNIYNQYFGENRKDKKVNNYGWTLDVVYFGPYVPPTPKPTKYRPIPTQTPEPTPSPTATPSPTPVPVCLSTTNTVTIQNISGNKYIFNGSYEFYGIGLGSYTFTGVPASHPIAFLNNGKESQVIYSGTNAQSPPKYGPDGNLYIYYWGDVTVTVFSNFGILSYADYFFGYYGGQNNIVFASPCTVLIPTPTPSPVACILVLSNNATDGIYNEQCPAIIPTGTPEPTLSPTPVPTPTATPTPNGKLWMWGSNLYGAIGTNSNKNSNNPTQTTYYTTDWYKLSAGFGHSIMVKSNGSLWAWGINLHGEVGNNNSISTSTPVQIGTDTNWIIGSAGIFNSAALKSDGSLWAWGSNEFGQIGNLGTQNISSPIQISGYTWKYVTANGGACFALKQDGTAWVWGRNNDGQLGLNDKNHRSSPTQLGITSDWILITSGAWHKAGIKQDGSLWLWGGNFGAQMGDGTTTNRSSPVQTITAGYDWKHVSCGFNHTAAIKNDGSMWLWGNNSIGQLGINNLANYRNPVRELTNSNDWTKVECGYYFNIALNQSNNIFVWGINDKGQLGTGNNVNLSSPVQYNFGIGQWRDITAGCDFAAGLSDLSLTPMPTPPPTPSPTPSPTPNACILILSNNTTIGIYNNSCPVPLPTGTPVKTLTPTPTKSPNPTPTPSPTPTKSPTPTPTPSPSPSPTPNACIIVLSNNATDGIYNQNCPNIIPNGTPMPTF